MTNTPKSLTDFFVLINEKKHLYSSSQTKIADYILTEPDLLSHLSVTKMAMATKTSQATVIRFCQLLGFEGFLDFSRHLRQFLQGYLGGQARFTVDGENLSKELFVYEEEFSHIYYANIGLLKSRLNEITKSDDFILTVDAMGKANSIYLSGFMSSYALTQMFYSILSRVCSNVHMVEIQNNSAYNSFKNIGKNSLVFNILFPRYPLETIKFAKLAKEKGATLVTITNSDQSPSLDISDLKIITPVNTIHFIDSYIEPLGVFTALALKYAQVNRSNAIENLRKFDDFVDLNQVFLK